MKQMTGFFIRGEYLGTRLVHGKPDQNGQTKETLYCGVKHFSEGKYGVEEHVTELCISKGLIQKGIPSKLHQFAGKVIELPYFDMPWSNGNGRTTFLANTVTELFDASVKAAS